MVALAVFGKEASHYIPENCDHIFPSLAGVFLNLIWLRVLAHQAANYMLKV
jgi:hypothetical protein